MEQGHKILFIIVGLGILAVLLGVRKTHNGLIVVGAPSDNPDDMVLGHSIGLAQGNLSGPKNLTANVPMYYPPPLMSLNPVTSKETGA